MSYEVDVRFGERYDISDFVKPNDLMVREVAKQYAYLPQEEQINGLWDYVCRNIEYPLTYAGSFSDRHRLEAFELVDMPFFGIKYKVGKTAEEFWQFPAETLTWGIGDCEDTATLLCSLLRNFLSPERVHVAAGYIEGSGHAWVELDGRILETTLTSVPVDLQGVSGEYDPCFYFNDMTYYRLKEGLMTKRDEMKKLAHLSQVWRHPVKGVRQ